MADRKKPLDGESDTDDEHGGALAKTFQEIESEPGAAEVPPGAESEPLEV